MTTTITATPAKLRDGSWGARVQGRVQKGATLTIQTRGGKRWQATVSRVIWSGDGVTLVATQSADRPARSGAYRSGRDAWGQYANGYCYHRCPVHGHTCSPEHGPCHDCE